MDKLRIGLLFGGESPEHDVSVASASAIFRSLDPKKYEVAPLGITADGRWIGGPPARRALELGDAAPLKEAGAPPALASSSRRIPLLPEKVDVIFPALHGPFGEDGTVQGFLELSGIPYVGSGVLASSMGMDKVTMKAIFRDAGLPVVPYQALLTKEWLTDPRGTLARVAGSIGFPCFVKPANQGSSVGISPAANEAELKKALDLAAQYDRRLLVEKAVDAREVEVAVLGNDKPQASLAGEIRYSHSFYDYEAKYTAGEMELTVPAPIAPEQMEELRSMAIAAFLAFDCAGMARVDFFLDRTSGAVYVNEINTIPGFTELSIYPKLWQASGIPYVELLGRLIELALERHAEKRSPAGNRGQASVLSIPFQWC